MVLIRGGTFTMGSPETEEQRESREGPQHNVTVPTFFMGRYPVTQAQWKRVAQFEQVERELTPNPSAFSDKDDSVGGASQNGNRRPVEQVSWYEAKEFCDRLCRFVEQHLDTPRDYRLPSEAEWEYACRAGTTTPFYCGDTITTDIVNYNDDYTYGKGVKGEYREKTTPVDHFKMANPWGLCDMHGNVYEWCLDHWHDSYKDAPTDGRAWIEGGNSDRRVVRGGAWGSGPRICRSAYRVRLSPGAQNSGLGFRVILAPR